MKILSFFAALVAICAMPAAGRAAPPAPGTYVIHSIDVGTGLAIFVEGSDFTLLYDAGSNDDTARGADNRVVAYLRAVRPDLTTIDHVILSHPHKDHSELMPDVLTSFRVGHIWDSGALNRICSYRSLLSNIAANPSTIYHGALGGPGTHSAAFVAQSGAVKANADRLPIWLAPSIGRGMPRFVLRKSRIRSFWAVQSVRKSSHV